MTGRLKLVDRSTAKASPGDEYLLPDESATARMERRRSSTPAPESPVFQPGPEQEPTAAGSSSNLAGKLIKYTIAAALLAALAAAGYNAYRFLGSHEETDDATIAGHIHMVSSRIAANVQEVLVDDNEHVQKGQVLLRLDPRDNNVQVAQAQAQLDLAKRQADVAFTKIAEMSESANESNTRAAGDVSESTAALANAKEHVADARSAVSAAKEQLLQAQATLEKNAIDYKRYAYLEGQGAVSTQQLDAARRDLSVSQAGERAAKDGIQQAQSRLAAAQQQVLQAQAHITTTRSEVFHAKVSQVEIQTARQQYQALLAGVQQAQTKLQDAQLQQSYTDIVAPVSGTIGRKAVEVGQRLQPSQQVMAIVPDDIWVVANFKETQLEKMHNGQAVEIKVDAFPHHSFSGHVDSLSPASGSQFALLPPDNATGNFTKIVQRVPVKIRFDSASIKEYADRLAPGMSVIATVETAH